jgi:hypothetical protein
VRALVAILHTYQQEARVPTKRTMELVVITVILLKPVTALARLWAHKTLGTAQPGSVSYGTAEIVSVIS